MNKLLLSLSAAVLILAAPASHAQVSVSVGQPGFYGHLDIGGYPAPQLISPQPVVIQPAYGVRPMYLYAPPKHMHNWKRYCGHYGACGAPVYFVQKSWYDQVYVPQYRRGYGYDHDDHDHDDDHGHKHKHKHKKHKHHDD